MKPTDLPPLHEADVELLRRVERELVANPLSSRSLLGDVRWRLAQGASATDHKPVASVQTPRCDHPGCNQPVTLMCDCRRCAPNNPDESFYTCPGHQLFASIEQKHRRVYPGHALHLIAMPKATRQFHSECQIHGKHVFDAPTGRGVCACGAIRA